MKLFEPVRLGALSLKNAIVMAPLTRNRADRNGVPAPYAVDYYAQRAEAGLLITEGTQPSFEGQGYARTPGLHTPQQAEAWRKITDAVHAKGGLIALQVMHTGRIAHRLNRVTDAAPVGPSAIAAAGGIWTDERQQQDFEAPRALETAEVASLVDEFTRTARLARETGFDAVEIHAANGYLPNQFLASEVNRRTDRYGGSVENRIRFPLELAQAISAEIGADRTGIRISPGHMFNDLKDQNPIETHVALLDALAPLKLAYVHLMRPDAFDASLNNAGDADELVAIVRRHVPGALIAAGGYTRERGEAALEAGLLQAIAYGRPFIANPDLVRRFKLDLPLAAPRAELFYTPGPEGYSDYPLAA